MDDDETALGKAAAPEIVDDPRIVCGGDIDARHPIRHAVYELEEIGRPELADVLEPIFERAMRREPLATA